MRRLLIAGLLSLSCIAASAGGDYKEGEHFERIKPEVPTHADGKVEVVEVFWYGCHHCYSFEPHISKWIKAQGDNVVVRRVPGIFSRGWVPHARAFYAAETLGVLDTIHTPLFEAIHNDRQKIGDEDSLAKFFAKYGVSEADFREAYNSFSVDTKTRQAMTLSKEYGITGVPSMIVNGRYRTSARLTGTYEDLLKVVDDLVDRESTE